MEANNEQIRLDVEPLDSYLRRTPADIARSHAKTANVVSLLLVSGLLLSLPIHIGCMLLNPSLAVTLTSAFDKWYATVGPLTGTAVGAYYIARSIASREEAR